MTDVTDHEVLIERAAMARERAYVPYSGFRMGAAVLTTGEEIVVGSLVENVSLGLAMCAERVALFACVAAGARPQALALVSPRTDGSVTFPCGACLQVALELGGPDLVVVAATTDGEVQQAILADLLPRGPRKA
ncbi:MAG: cytidine deaminase [Actinomycetota bacterium]|nr:cytidine deaminase [Actinomycetota bacterium]